LQGPAAPSTLEVYLDRWTHYFATDPDWCSVFCLFYAKGGAEPEPLAHHVFCRRLAAALAPMWVEPVAGLNKPRKLEQPAHPRYGLGGPLMCAYFFLGFGGASAAAGGRCPARSLASRSL